MTGIGKRITTVRERLKLTKTAFAQLIGVSQPTVTRWESEDDYPDEQHLRAIAKHGRKSVIWLRYGREVNQEDSIPMLGYIGAGEAVVPFDDHPKGQGLEQVPSIPGLDEQGIAALRVRGDSMRPALRDGWLIYFRRDQEGVPRECIGQVCVVKLADGRVLVKEVRRGAERGRYDLYSWNSATEPMEDQQVEWASLVLGFRRP